MEGHESRVPAKNPNENQLKTIMYIMVAVAVVLAAILAYIWYERTALVNDLKLEKEDLTAQMIALPMGLMS